MRRRFALDLPMVAGGVLCILVGGLFAGIGAWHLWHTARALSEGERVIATVIEVRGDGDTYRPLFSYTTGDGVERQAESLLSASNYGFATGSQMPVYTAPGGGGPVRVGGFWNLWLFGGVFFLMGAPFPIMGIWVLWRFGRSPF